MVKVVVTGMSLDQNAAPENRAEKIFHADCYPYPEIWRQEKYETQGFVFLSENQLALENADIVLCVEATQDIISRIKKLPAKIYKILQARKSVLHDVLSHSHLLIQDPVWDVVLTWNRSFEAQNIIYYDIPMAGKSVLGLPDTLPTAHGEFHECGVVIASRKDGDHRGFIPERNTFYKALSRSGAIDLYGNGWRNEPDVHQFGEVDSKINIMKKYSYALVIENMYVSGYATEKLADCILAGIPVIYLGDCYNAQKRFPDTFVPLPEISMKAFADCKRVIEENYTSFYQSVRNCYQNSDDWSSSYINALDNALNRFRK